MAEKENSDATCLLPISRIRTIMKSSPDVSNISQEALFMIAKSTVLLIAIYDILQLLFHNLMCNSISFVYKLTVDLTVFIMYLIGIAIALLHVRP